MSRCNQCHGDGYIWVGPEMSHPCGFCDGGPPTPDEQPARWLRFAEGWGVPDPSDDFIGDAIWRIAYGTPTKVDVRHMVSLAQVFVHLAMHPSGTEACVKQLREIRRRLRETDQ